MNPAGVGCAGDDKDRMISLAAGADAGLTVKGSRFLAFAGPVKSKGEAEAFFRALSKRYHDAAHICFGYRIGDGDRLQSGSSDAGEPSGTAGQPILRALVARGLSDTVCAVVRYFGGVKLGTGGLARAYAQAAAGALDRAPRAEIWITVPFRLRFSYEWTGVVRALLGKYHATEVNTVFDADTEMEIRIRRSRSETFVKDLLDATSGRVHAEFADDGAQRPKSDKRG